MHVATRSAVEGTIEGANVRTRAHARTHARARTHRRTHARTYAHTHKHVHSCMHARTHQCAAVHVYMHGTLARTSMHAWTFCDKQATALVKKLTTMLRAPMLGRVEVLGDDYLSIIKLRRQNLKSLENHFKMNEKQLEARLKPNLKVTSSEPQIVRNSFKHD